MLIDVNAKREVYFIFQDSACYIGHRFMRRGFRHVFAVERHATGWVCYDPNMRDLYCWPLPCEQDAEFIDYYKFNNPSDTMLKIVFKPRDQRTYARLSLMTCVSVMKYILGVRWPFVITPYRLYSKLTSQTHKDMEITQ